MTRSRRFHEEAKGFLAYRTVNCRSDGMVIAAIAVPNLLKARISANESSAVGSIRTLAKANIQYAAQRSLMKC
jgi:hypothetical protein